MNKKLSPEDRLMQAIFGKPIKHMSKKEMIEAKRKALKKTE